MPATKSKNKKTSAGGMKSARTVKRSLNGKSSVLKKKAATARLTAPAQAIPEGMSGVLPHLCVNNCAAAIEFYKKAFGAEELGRMSAPDGRRIMHARIQIGDAAIFLNDDFPEMCGGTESHPLALGATPVTLHRYVKDVDSTIDRAVKAGATLKMPAADMFWGDRYGIVVDPFGHKWSIATHQKDLTPAQMATAAKEAFAQFDPSRQRGGEGCCADECDCES